MCKHLVYGGGGGMQDRPAGSLGFQGCKWDPTARVHGVEAPQMAGGIKLCPHGIDSLSK